MDIINPDAFLQLLLLVMASDLNFYPSQNNTDTSHRQCDNLDPTDQWTKEILETADTQDLPDYDEFWKQAPWTS